MILGHSGVGKSTIINRFMTGEYNENVKVSLSLSVETKTLDIKGNSVKFSIWDTAGNDIFKSIIRAVYIETSVVFLVYNINNRYSFEKVNFWLNEARNTLKNDCLYVLIGNKKDLPREINSEEAIDFMSKNKIDLFFEISAKTGEAFNESFMNVLEKFSKQTENIRSMKKDVTEDIRLDNRNGYCNFCNT